MLSIIGLLPRPFSRACRGALVNETRGAVESQYSPACILPLYSPRPCFVLLASTYQSALLSSPTVSDRFLPRSPQHGFNATCVERFTRYMRLVGSGCALPHRL